MVQTAMQDLFDIPMSLGTVNSLRLEASIAVKDIVNEAKQYVQKQPVVGADETSFEKSQYRWVQSGRTPSLVVGCGYTASHIF